MFNKGSRYENTKGFTNNKGNNSNTISLDEKIFGGVRPRKIIPATGILEYIVKEGDRLDLISLHFYNNTRKWWRILDANPQIIFGADLMLEDYIGETIFIPRSTEVGA